MRCHVRHLNCKGKNLWGITREDKEIAKNLNYNKVEFPVSKKYYCKISLMNKININVFSDKGKVIFPIYLSDQSVDDTLDLLLVCNHYVYIKDFNRMMFNKNKCKNKKWFCKSCLQCFSSEIVLNKHKEDCLLINAGRNLKLEKGFIEFKNFNKMVPAPLKIYADFECLLENVDSGINNDCFSYNAKYQDHIPCSFAYKLVCVNDKFSKDIVLYRGKNAVYKFIQCIFKEFSHCRPVTKNRFNKNLVMTIDEEEKFERSNICWICDGLIENGDKNIRDHCHITDKYRGAAHWCCNINLKLSKKLVVIFHNLKGYDSHLIFKELSNLIVVLVLFLMDWKNI